MESDRRKKLYDEMYRIYKSHGDILNPKDVFEFAKHNRKSAVAKEICWDKDRALLQYNLERIRHLIQESRDYIVSVEVKDVPIEEREVFVSTINQQHTPKSEGARGGYFAKSDLLKTAKGRHDLTETAATEIRAFHKSFNLRFSGLPLGKIPGLLDSLLAEANRLHIHATPRSRRPARRGRRVAVASATRIKR